MMPFLDYIWILIGILLSVQQSFSFYTEAKNRAKLLKNILLDDIYTLQQKRGHGQENRRVVEAEQLEFRECCPAYTQTIAPLGGLSREGTLLQLFRDATTVQKFYETTCAPGVLNFQCRYIDESYKTFSKCEQKYTYTYAIVKDFNVTQPYRIDYIKIKSGCSCVVGHPVLDVL